MWTTAIKLEKDKFEGISGLVKDAVQESGIVNGACIVTVSVRPEVLHTWRGK